MLIWKNEFATAPVLYAEIRRIWSLGYSGVKLLFGCMGKGFDCVLKGLQIQLGILTCFQLSLRFGCEKVCIGGCAVNRNLNSIALAQAPVNKCVAVGKAHQSAACRKFIVFQPLRSHRFIRECYRAFRPVDIPVFYMVNF